MATIKRTISAKSDKFGRSEILFRISVSRGLVVRLKTGVFVEKERFANGRLIMPRKGNEDIKRIKKAEDDLSAIESAILDVCLTGEDLDKERFEEIAWGILHPESKGKKKAAEAIAKAEESDFHNAFAKFIETKDISEHFKREYRVVARLLHRYERFVRLTGNKRFALDLDAFSHEDMAGLEKFYRNEWRIYDKYPQIYDDYPAKIRSCIEDRRPAPRGDNAWTDIHKKVRAFFSWCRRMGITDNNPSLKYEGKKKAIYGTPWYLTIEERDRIADCNLSSHPALAIQRDIFIFQCHVGCRVSDLRLLTKDNIVGATLQYIPIKTSKDRGEVVNVPLTAVAAALAKKYPEGRKLFPFISDQKYNEAIKKICLLAGIDRRVTILNPTTGKTEQRPIYEIASSHLARRTFIGNLYRKVKDPNIIGSMTGHVEGSVAFARYRSIDNDIKRDIVSLIE